MDREKLLEDLKFAIDAGDVELAAAIDKKLRQTAQPSQGYSHVAAPKSPSEISSVRDFFIPRALSEPSPQSVAADPAVRWAQGAGKGAYGTMDFLMRAARDQGAFPQFSAPIRLIEELASRRGVKEDNLITEGFKTSRELAKEAGVNYDVTGLIGETMNPAGLYFQKAMPRGANLASRAGQGATAGAFYGASTLDDPDQNYWTNKAIKAGSGAAIGATIPLAESGIKSTANFAKELWKYFLSPNAARNVADEYTIKVVGRENMPKLVEAAKNAKEIVPGSKPTTAEALAGIPEASPIAAIQKRTAASPSGISGMFGRRYDEQQAAREAALRSEFGDKETLKNLIRTAENNAERNYGPLMGIRVSPESDASLLLRDLQATRGVPQWQPSQGSGPFVGKAGALQQWGKAATDEATQTSLANRWTPVEGMPRVSPRYSPNKEVADQARVAAQEALEMAGVKGKEADFLQTMIDRLDRAGVGAKQGLDTLQSRPSMAHALAYARNLAKEKGRFFPSKVNDEFTAQNLHDIKLGLDDAIRRGSARDPITGATAADNSTLAAMAQTKDDFLSWMKTKVPGYDKARKQFAEDMMPVNQARVGQSLISKLTRPTGEESPGSFIRAAMDEAGTIKKATGQPRYTFEQLFNPRQQDVISRVTQDLERSVSAMKPSQATNLTSDIAKESVSKFPSLLERPFVIANWMLSKIASKSGPLEAKVDEINAFRMLNPEAFAKAFELLPQTQKETMRQMFAKAGYDMVNQGVVAPTTAGLMGD